MSYDVDQVRNELATLINDNPNNTGKLVVDHYNDGGDETCVYYTNEDGSPIDTGTYGEYDEEPVFATPVCIIGHWIENFHPELKNNFSIKRILLKNHSLRGVGYTDLPFRDDVWTLLAETQKMQDRPGTRWSDIDFSVL